MANHDCPNCLSTQVNDSRMRYYESPVGLLCLKPYRCSKCKHRFWRVSGRQSDRIIPYVIYTVGFVACLGVMWATISFVLNTR